MKITLLILFVFAAVYCEAMVAQGGSYHHQGQDFSASGTGVGPEGGTYQTGGCSKDGSSCSSSISVGGGGGQRNQQQQQQQQQHHQQQQPYEQQQQHQQQQGGYQQGRPSY